MLENQCINTIHRGASSWRVLELDGKRVRELVEAKKSPNSPWCYEQGVMIEPKFSDFYVKYRTGKTLREIFVR